MATICMLQASLIITWCFSPKYSKRTHHSSAMWMRYGVSFVSSTSILCSIFFTVCLYTKLLNTLRQRQNGRHFTDTFKCFLLNENVGISIKISWKFVPNDLINNIPALIQLTATSHYLNQWQLTLQTSLSLDLNKMATIFPITFSNAISWWKIIWFWLKF